MQLVVAPERGGSPRLSFRYAGNRVRDSPFHPLDPDPKGSFLLHEMTNPTLIPTDLLTPLGAYLRLRREGTASFLLESVEQGRLGRYSLVGSGSRLLDYEEAEQCGEPV